MCTCPHVRVSKQSEMEQDNECGKKRVAEAELAEDVEREQKRTKLEPEVEQLLDATLVEWTELEQLVNVTKAECEKEMSDWFDACDPAILHHQQPDEPALYGWGGQAVGTDFIKEHAENYLKCSSAENMKQLGLDHTLAKSVGTGLHIIRAIAHEWARQPGCCYGSYELQLLFHVLRHHAKAKQAEHLLLPLLARMLEFASQAAPHTLKTVPEFGKTLVATVFYSNLALLCLHTSHDFRRFALCTGNIKEQYGFYEIVAATLFKKEAQSASRSKSLILAAEKARDLVIVDFECYLATRSASHKMLPRPLVIKMETTFSL